MTVNQVIVHSSVALIPVPLYKLGQAVTWELSNELDAQPGRVLTGVITEQVFRIDCDRANWQYSAAVTSVKKNGDLVYHDPEDWVYDIDEIHIKPFI